MDDNDAFDNTFLISNTKWYPVVWIGIGDFGWEGISLSGINGLKLSVKDIEIYLKEDIKDKFNEVWSKSNCKRSPWVLAFPDSLLDSYYERLKPIYELREQIQDKIITWNKNNRELTIKLDHPRPEELYDSPNELIKTIMMTIVGEISKTTLEINHVCNS